MMNSYVPSREIKICPVNLLQTCQGVFIPNCLVNLIVCAKTFESNPDNQSDHMPIEVAIKYTWLSVYVPQIGC